MIPVSPGREAWFIALLVGQYAAGLVVLAGAYWIGWFGGIKGLELLMLIAPLIVVATAHSILIVEGVPMVAEQFLRRREERGERRGEERGQEQGRREMQQLWEAWNQRRLQAEKEGKEFNESPPKAEAG